MAEMLRWRAPVVLPLLAVLLANNPLLKQHEDRRDWLRGVCQCCYVCCRTKSDLLWPCRTMILSNFLLALRKCQRSCDRCGLLRFFLEAHAIHIYICIYTYIYIYVYIFAIDTWSCNLVNTWDDLYRALVSLAVGLQAQLEVCTRSCEPPS